MASVLSEIVFDCDDPGRVATFWAAVLGWEPQADRDYVWMTATGRPEDRPALCFCPVPERKTVKNRVHVDVNPRGCTRDEEVERLVALGARRVDVGQGDVPWTVLADVEGNEFCVLGRTVD